jgi:LAS superfamily LD-carboxypeptidase LdcB
VYNSYASRDGSAAADRYSARPGHSEHQSGLAFDLNTITEAFGYTPEGQWVAANAHRFGFIVRYPQGKEGSTGYIWEPWHLRYLGVDTATAVYNSGLSLEEYLGITSVYN